MTDLNINQYYEDLDCAIAQKNGKAILKIISELEMSQLLNTSWEEDVFVLVLSFLKREDFLKLQASLRIIIFIYDDYSKISEQQRTILFEYFNKKIPETAHPDFLYSIADFVARNHSKEEAFAIFKKWFKTGSPVNQDVGKSGLETLLIMSGSNKFEPAFIKKIEKTLGWRS